MHKIEIDDDTADGIVICSLRSSIQTLEGEVKRYKKKKKLTDWEKMDLSECVLSLEHIKKTFDYYGGK